MAANLAANILTISSLFCGFISIIFSLESHFTFASWAIILSVVFDGLDGQVARMNPLPSEFGKQLDSLVDVVCFGIAPAVLGYVFVYRDFHFWATAALFIYLVAGVMRLAKYNITPREAILKHFIGLPTTASGGILASFILVYRGYTRFPPPILFLLLVIALTGLMVSNIKYLNLEGLKEFLGSSLWPVIAIIATLILVLFIFYSVSEVFLPEVAVFTLFTIYLFSPLFIRKLV
ncbi:MAG: CDP-diacylglycerol--serine O-phosphatidyltransferase [Candidatus Omnitrophota bacterium]|nr:CDP-diacylglycerol--serine O-phosphatidyltransferase [Candidatus Omnitrophota bacterium]